MLLPCMDPLAAVAVEDSRVGERKPAPPERQRQGMTPNPCLPVEDPGKAAHPGCSCSRGRPQHSHFCFLALSVMPAVPGLRHQQRDEVTLLEAQEGAVISGSVRENGLHPRPAVPLEPCGHGAGARQRLVFGWWETETNECPRSFPPRPNPGTGRGRSLTLLILPQVPIKTSSV